MPLHSGVDEASFRRILSRNIALPLGAGIVTGDEAFLAPYETAKPKLLADIGTLAELVSDNAPQVDRMIRIRALQAQWDKVADALIDARRRGVEIAPLLRSGRGAPNAPKPAANSMRF